jgi:flagellar motor switch protein FliG
VATADIRKAAVVLMSLPQEQAAGLLSKLPQRQIEAVATEIAKSHAVTAEEQQSVILEFADANPQSIVAGRGGFDVAKTLVERALGKANRTMDRIRQSIDPSPLAFLRHSAPKQLLAYLVDEHPQTIALVLSHLPTSYAAAIVPALSDEQQLAVLRRIAAMGETSPEMVREVAHALEWRMSYIMGQPFETTGGVDAAADILHGANRGVLEHLSRQAPELATAIRRSMFAFDDIDTFSNRDIQTISKNVDSWQWAASLQGADDELQQNLLAKLSPRSRALVEKETERLGSVNPATIERVRRQIVDIVRRLHDAGKISLPSDNAAEEFPR